MGAVMTYHCRATMRSVGLLALTLGGRSANRA